MIRKLFLSASIAFAMASFSSGSFAVDAKKIDDTAEIRSLLSSKIGLDPDLINKSTFTKMPDSDIYEIVIDKQIIYATKNAKYLFVEGSLIDTSRQANVTAERMEQLNKVEWKDLDLKNAIKIVKGKGQREIAVFSDPDCPYCKKLEQELAGMDNYTMYLFLMPIKELHPTAPSVAESIWCSKDKAKAWTDYMSGKEAPDQAKCANPIEKNIQWAKGRSIFGTPAIIGKNGKVNPGYLPKDRLEKWISENSPAKM